VRGRKSGTLHSVVVNVLRVDGTDYLVSPRGNTQWARNARAAGAVELGPRWRHTPIALTEGHVAGLTPNSNADQLRAAAPVIPVFALAR
jgi:hypothetical protein